MCDPPQTPGPLPAKCTVSTPHPSPRFASNFWAEWIFDGFFSLSLSRMNRRCIGTSPPLLRGPHITGENRHRRQDGIPEQFQLIYKSKASTIVYCVKSAAIITFVGIAASWIYCYLTGATIDPSTRGLLLVPTSIDEMKWLSCIGIVMNLLAFRISHMCLHRIYRHEKKYELLSMPPGSKPSTLNSQYDPISMHFRYIAIIPGCIPQLNSKLAFNRGELTEPVITSWSPLNKITHKIGNRSVVIIPPRFRTPAEYHDAMANPATYVLRKKR